MLTDAKARKLHPGAKPILVGGVTGLYLRAGSAIGCGKFILRFVSPETGKRRDMGLGPYPTIGLANARAAGIKARWLLAQGVDPIENRQQGLVAERRATETPTFEEAAQHVYESVAPSFRNSKHQAQWISTLRKYAFPFIGTQRVDLLTTSDFGHLLERIWLDKPETASRVKQRCDRVMTWCVANQYSSVNPVSSVAALLPKQKPKHDIVVHFPAAPWRDLPSIITQLFTDEQLTVGKQALFFLILTAARSGEIRGAAWNEISFDEKVWVIPAKRMKAGRLHRVPLNDQALALLDKRSVDHLGGELIFSTRQDKKLSDMTLTKVLRDHKVQSDVSGRVATAHGFRSSFRDWASENQYSRDLAERALAHTIRSATEAAYHRTDQLEQRRSMMQAWGDWVVAKDKYAGP